MTFLYTKGLHKLLELCLSDTREFLSAEWEKLFTEHSDQSLSSVKAPSDSCSHSWEARYFHRVSGFSFFFFLSSLPFGSIDLNDWLIWIWEIHLKSQAGFFLPHNFTKLNNRKYEWNLITQKCFFYFLTW